MNLKLKPCPFCGWEANVQQTAYTGLYYVVCSGCGIEQPLVYKTKEEAVKVWNTRAKDVTQRTVHVDIAGLEKQ